MNTILFLKKPTDMEPAVEGEDPRSTLVLDASHSLAEMQPNTTKYPDKTRMLSELRQLYDHIYTRS
jgi:hypothetical protein